MAEFLTIKQIEACVNELPFECDPKFAGLKEVVSKYVPAGSHIYENDKYMVFYGDGNEGGFAYEKRDWLNEPTKIDPLPYDRDIMRERILSRYGL